VNSTIHLCSLIAARRAEILERWTQRIGREHPDKELTRGELWDDLPHFFDEALASVCAEEDSSLAATAPNADGASAAHGTQRLRVGFDLVDVVREYEILTECILDEVDAVGGSVSTRALRRVQRLINEGREAAVSAYVDRRDAEMAHAHSQHVAFIAHELRGPLMTSFLALTTLRKSARPEQGWALNLLVRNLTVLRELIDQVLTADRLAEHAPLAREPLDLCLMLAQVLVDARLVAEQRHIKLTVNAPATLPFRGDRRLLRSAITNVLGNAIKFTPEGHAITVRADRRDHYLVIEVEDECGGLPDGDAAELFDPFVQRGENRAGFGLGLAIVKQALEAHGGRVLVRNLPGKGCVFSLELPEVPDSAQPGACS
jgi:signal transduction histidine kinase